MKTPLFNACNICGETSLPVWDDPLQDRWHLCSRCMVLDDFTAWSGGHLPSECDENDLATFLAAAHDCSRIPTAEAAFYCYEEMCKP